jgi:hypothetical protein
VSNDTTKTELDLGHQDPTGRAAWHHQLSQTEELQVEAHTGNLGGAAVKVVAKLFAGSGQSMAMATLILAAIVAGIAGTARWLGLPPMTSLIAGIATTAGLHLLNWFTCGRRTRRRGDGT